MTEKKPPTPTGLADATRHQHTKTLHCRSRGRRGSDRSSHAVEGPGWKSPTTSRSRFATIASPSPPRTSPLLPVAGEEDTALRPLGEGNAVQSLRYYCRLAERKRVTGLSGPPGCSATLNAAALFCRCRRSREEVVEEAAAPVPLPYRRLSSASPTIGAALPTQTIVARSSPENKAHSLLS
nr:hypothetical protein Iba_scaffold259CG0090 [Ipomoea batatas]